MKKADKKMDLTRAKRLYRLVFAKRHPGVCRVCGCTMFNPCSNPEHGNCWWWDGAKTLCSHCASREIFDNPDTVHCVNDNRPCH